VIRTSPSSRELPTAMNEPTPYPQEFDDDALLDAVNLLIQYEFPNVAAAEDMTDRMKALLSIRNEILNS